MSLLAAFASGIGAAQDGKALVKQPDQPYTLHVYTNLIQIPSLVLTPSLSTFHGLQSGDFSLRLDDGPLFHPVHTRLEGNDPIALALLLDRTANTDTSLVNRLEAAMDRLPPNLLRPGDHVTIYALNCSLVRSMYEPSSVESLRREIGRLLHGPEVHGAAEAEGKCRKRLELWDAISAVASQLHDVSGRRVILALTDGSDAGGANSWERVRQYASDHSIAIFAIHPDTRNTALPIFNGRVAPLQDNAPSLDNLQMLCEGTGGLLLSSTAGNVGSGMERVVDLLRGRYILEFPRAKGSEPGLHRINVSVPDRNAVIHTSGIAVPVEDKRLLEDPNTVPTDDSRLPVMGTSKDTKEPR